MDLLKDEEDPEYAAWVEQLEDDGHRRAKSRLRVMSVFAWLPVFLMMLLVVAGAVTIVAGIF